MDDQLVTKHHRSETRTHYGHDSTPNPQEPLRRRLDQETQALQLIAGAGRIMKSPLTPMHPAQP